MKEGWIVLLVGGGVFGKGVAPADGGVGGGQGRRFGPRWKVVRVWLRPELAHTESKV